jgi:hypothetical protein
MIHVLTWEMRQFWFFQKKRKKETPLRSCFVSGWGPDEVIVALRKPHWQLLASHPSSPASFGVDPRASYRVLLVGGAGNGVP